MTFADYRVAILVLLAVAALAAGGVFVLLMVASMMSALGEWTALDRAFGSALLPAAPAPPSVRLFATGMIAAAMLLVRRRH